MSRCLTWLHVHVPSVVVLQSVGTTCKHREGPEDTLLLDFTHVLILQPDLVSAIVEHPHLHAKHQEAGRTTKLKYAAE